MTAPQNDRQREVINKQLNDKDVFINSPNDNSVTADGRSRDEILKSIAKLQYTSDEPCKRFGDDRSSKFLESSFIESFLYDFMTRHREITVEMVRYS